MPYLGKFFGNLKSKAMKVKYIILVQVKRNRIEKKIKMLILTFFLGLHDLAEKLKDLD